MTSPDVVTPVDHTEQLRILASLLLGTCFGVILYGISVHQTYIFVSLQQTQQAARVPKPLVKIILLLETIHSGLCIHAAYDLLVTDRALGVIPDKPRWSMDILNVFAAVIFCFTQSLFGRQVYLIWPTYGLVIVSAAGLLTAGQLGAATAATALLYMPRTVALTRKIRLLGVARSAAVMIASALLAGALIHRLRSLRSFTDFRKTDHRIKALITYTSNTGLLIGISSLLSLIFALAWPQGQLCIAIDIVATQLYAVSLLTELNCSREYVYTDGSSIITETVRSPSVLAQPSSQWVNLYTSRRASRGHHMSVRSSDTYTVSGVLGVGAHDACILGSIIFGVICRDQYQGHKDYRDREGRWHGRDTSEGRFVAAERNKESRYLEPHRYYIRNVWSGGKT